MEIVKEALQKTAAVAKALCFVHVTTNYLCHPVQLPGPSMLPTINHNDIALAETISTRRGRVGPGDVVIIRSPEQPTKFITKRIKAVGGDVVSYAPDPNTADQKKTLVGIRVFVESSSYYAMLDHYPFKFMYQRGMFGSKGIICTTVEIPDSLVQFLARIYRAEYSLWCGHLKLAD